MVLKLEVVFFTLDCNLQARMISHHVGVPSPELWFGPQKCSVWTGLKDQIIIDILLFSSFPPPPDLADTEIRSRWCGKGGIFPASGIQGGPF